MGIINRFATENYVETSIEKVINTVISIPKTATVGQFITVKSVDDNSVVTETEAVTIPYAEGGRVSNG